VDWARTNNNLANAYIERIRGIRDENLEKAIEYCNQALNVYTQNYFPVDWARAQNNMANAYWNRIRGSKAENIEKAIKYCNQALKVYTKKNFPLEWAATENNMANIYLSRIKGNKAENFEEAIEHFNKALEVFTLENSPFDWALIQNNLATAYRDRILGDRVSNIEDAIEHYNQSLKVRTRDNFPVDWAMTQNNLALTYNARVRGDKAKNIEKSIEYLIRALDVYTQRDFPIQWAWTQNNLAVTYKNRILGDRADNVEKAIGYFNDSLKVRTQNNFPVDWAATYNDLGSAYCNRILGDRADNIEKAIGFFNEALTVRTQKDFPVDWAGTLNNLAAAYCLRAHGDKADNIEKAIEYFNQALVVQTKNYLPIEWATTQKNLAGAYRDLTRGNQIKNIEKAINYCHNALNVFKLESMPNDFLKTCGLLGDLYFEINNWYDAFESYKNGIKACNLLYKSGLSAESKSIEVNEDAYIYRNATFTAYYAGLVNEALLIHESGKTRLLIESLRLKMKQPAGISESKWIKYEQAAQKYRTVTKLSDNEADYSQKEKEVQKALEELDAAAKDIQRHNPDFQKELDISDILSTLDKETALLTFCITYKGSIGFIVSKSRGIQAVEIPYKKEDLDNLLFQHDEQGLVTGGWIGNYLSYLNALGTSRHENAFWAWQKTLNDVLSITGTRLFYPLLERLPPQTKRLILLPSSGLSLLPLHSVPLPNGQPLCQQYCISYAPSIQLLEEMQNKAETINGKDLYAVVNPEEDPAFVFTEYEGQAISKLFQSSQVNIGETGTWSTVLDGVLGQRYLHFSCHGSYNWNDPLQSGLHLVGGRTLSLADLQNGIVDMSSARLVTLSACETGITDIVKGSADEFVGLPAGFMLAGVPCVVSSLWSVPDISTAILMERFYSNHIVKGMDIPHALQDAQLWVRNLTAKQVADYVEKCYHSGKWEGKRKEFIEQYRERCLRFAEKSPGEKPFQHPYN
jgi:CHAT domain-containing protein